MDTLTHMHSVVEQRLPAIPQSDNDYEITVPREGHVAKVIINTPKQARVSIQVGGVVVWSEDVENGVAHLPNINLLKTGYHAVCIVVNSCGIVAEDIVADVRYVLLEDIADKRKLACEGLPNIHGWELTAESGVHRNVALTT